MPLESRHGGGGRVVMAFASVAVIGVLGLLAWSALTRSGERLPSLAATAPAFPQELAALPPSPIVNRKPTLAVMEFASIGHDPQQEHFAEGFTEELAVALARMPGVVVAARGTGFALKDRPEKTQQIGRELGVEQLLTGSVTRTDTDIRVIARLVDIASGRPVWQEIFDRPLAELFMLEQELAEHAANEIAPDARRGDGERAGSVGANTLAAHDLTLRARSALRTRDRDGAHAARALAEQAFVRDPGFAPAYMVLAAGLAASFENRWDADYASKPLARRMSVASETAIKLAPLNAEAHALLAVAQSFMTRPDAAAIEAERAIALAPEDANVLALAAKAMLGLGRFERTVLILRKAKLLDPAGVTLDASATLGAALYQLRRYPDAIEALRPCAAPDSRGTFCHVMLAAALAQAGLGEEATLETEALQRLSPGFTIAENSRREALIARDPAWARHTAEGLHKAGVPD